jgi:hypothetical protein
MIVAGVIITVSVIGGTVAAVQSGIFLNATTSIEANGEIDVPVLPTASLSPNESQPQVANDTPAEAQATETQSPEATGTTASDPAADVLAATPRVIVRPNSSRAAVMLAKLNEADRLMRERDNTYQARLKEAYNQLKATPAAAVRTNVSTPARTTPLQPTSPLVIRTKAKHHKAQRQGNQQEKQRQKDQGQQQQRDESTRQQGGGKDKDGDKDSHDASHKKGEH